ncbi:GNAT family N-acetyltransferase [Nonomuraea sp. NPDC047529]|uniref:GNAT family N-acetyltransferase n=1 Tax=Nonomuraea sp. NPDC047529 TaxID=3155623 RepID=UPI0033E904C8
MTTTTRQTPDLATEVVTGSSRLRALAGEWADLHDRSPAATPFQSHVWLSSWWETYGRNANLSAVLLRRRGRLVAAAPVMTVRRAGLRVLRPLGGDQSDFTDVLIEDGDPDLPAALGRALAELPGWDVLDLPEVRPGADAERLAAAWPGRSWRLPASTCVELPGVPLGRLLAGLPGKNGNKLRRELRRVDEAPIQVRDVPAAEAEHAVARLLDLHALQWQGRGINVEHTKPRFRAHLARAARRLVAEQQARLIEYHLDGQVVAVDLVIVGKDFVGGYLYGTHPDLRAQVDVVTLLLRTDLGLAHELGRPTMSLLRGAESHKTKWGGQCAVSHRLLLARTPAATAYALAARARVGGRTLRGRWARLDRVRGRALGRRWEALDRVLRRAR